MKKALVVGATGLVGRQLLELLLADERYDKVVALTRKSSLPAHKKLTELTFDFDRPDTNLLVADELFCCLGTTIKTAGSKEAFYKVDYEYVLTIAKAAHGNGTKKFALVSSMGANKKSWFFYNRTKGDIEEAVARIGFASVYILRPSMLLGERPEFRLGEQVGKVVMAVIGFALPLKYKSISGRQVARAMITCMNTDRTGLQVIESDGIAVL